jgi:hypothetical protein
MGSQITQTAIYIPTFNFGDKAWVTANVKAHDGTIVNINGIAIVGRYIATHNVYKIKHEGRTCYVRPKCLEKL